MPTVTAPTRIKLQNILFATDFSPSAQPALSHALDLARRYGAVLYTVNVLPHTCRLWKLRSRIRSKPSSWLSDRWLT